MRQNFPGVYGPFQNNRSNSWLFPTEQIIFSVLCPNDFFARRQRGRLVSNDACSSRLLVDVDGVIFDWSYLNKYFRNQ